MLKREKWVKKAGHILTQGLLQLGPLYCKLGQILSCREDVLPESWIQSLEQLQDQVPAQTGDKARELAIAAWKEGRNHDLLGNFDEVFSDFDTTPLAAASLGQVHKAVLRETNDTVAIKLQRPYLRQIYDQDLEFLTKIARIVDRLSGKRSGVEQSWTEIFESAEAILYREIDYRDEAENGIRFCDDFGLDKGGKPKTPSALAKNGEPLPSAAAWLRAPHVYGKYCSEKVLVMEFVPSIKITNAAKLAKADVTAEERAYLADCLGRSYLRQFCSHLFFSTDPHPGNLGCEIVQEDGKDVKKAQKKNNFFAANPGSSPSTPERVRLVFYDFGQAATLTEGQADGILEIIEAIVDMNVDQSMEAFKKMGVLKENADMDKVRAKIADNYKTGKVKANRKRLQQRGYKFAASKETKDASAASAQSDDSAKEAKVRDTEVMGYFTLPAEYAFVGRALTQMAGVGKTLDSDFDFISSAAPWIYEVEGASQYLKKEVSKKLADFGLDQIMPKYKSKETSKR